MVIKCNDRRTRQSVLTTPLKKCAKCQRAIYCSKERQTAHWNSHKATCSLTQAQTGQSPIEFDLSEFKHNVSGFQKLVRSKQTTFIKNNIFENHWRFSVRQVPGTLPVYHLFDINPGSQHLDFPQLECIYLFEQVAEDT